MSQSGHSDTETWFIDSLVLIFLCHILFFLIALYLYPFPTVPVVSVLFAVWGTKKIIKIK